MTCKLLVVDDEPGMGKVMGLMARQLEWEYCWVGNSQDAVASYVGYRPHVTVIDMIMPERDGIDVLHDILLTGIPSKFILMSGFGDTYLRLGECVAHFHAAPVAAILQKPFRRMEFLDVLSKLVPAAG